MEPTDAHPPFSFPCALVIDTGHGPVNGSAMPSAQDLISALELEPHPEGGWFRETWRAPAAQGERAASTAILYLLKTGECSHWHSVDADEIWLWQSGDPLILRTAAHARSVPASVALGHDPACQQFQAIVPAHQWQAAEPVAGPHGYTLVSCVVAPGFAFEGFTLAPPGWEPGS